MLTLTNGSVTSATDETSVVVDCLRAESPDCICGVDDLVAAGAGGLNESGG